MPLTVFFEESFFTLDFPFSNNSQHGFYMDDSKIQQHEKSHINLDEWMMIYRLRLLDLACW